MPCIFPCHHHHYTAKKKLVLLWLTIIIIVVSHHRDSNPILTSAFVVVPQQQANYYGRRTTRPITRTTRLDAIFRPTTFRRRGIFNFFRRILFAAWTAKSSVAAAPPPSSFLSPGRTTRATVGKGGGRVVRFVVDNLDGIQGHSGTIYIQLRPEWAPRGVKRFEELTAQQFWNDNKVYRVIPGYISQFGIHGDPSVQSKWRSKTIQDDYGFHPHRWDTQDDSDAGDSSSSIMNKYGTISFSTTSTAPGGRTTQIFINTNPHGNRFLDDANFVPIGEVIGGTMDVVERFYSGYGSCYGGDNGEHGCDIGRAAAAAAVPNPGMIQLHGNSYLEKEFPNLTYIQKASFVTIPNTRKKQNFQA